MHTITRRAAFSDPRDRLHVHCRYGKEAAGAVRRRARDAHGAVASRKWHLTASSGSQPREVEGGAVMASGARRAPRKCAAGRAARGRVWRIRAAARCRHRPSRPPPHLVLHLQSQMHSQRYLHAFVPGRGYMLWCVSRWFCGLETHLTDICKAHVIRIKSQDLDFAHSVGLSDLHVSRSAACQSSHIGRVNS